MEVQKFLNYKETLQAKKFFKKHPELKEDFIECIRSIFKNVSSISNYDLIPLKGKENFFRYRKGSKRVVFMMTSTKEIVVVEVKEANNRGDMYKK